jgi:hypothetical protein
MSLPNQLVMCPASYDVVEKLQVFELDAMRMKFMPLGTDLNV